MPPKKQAPKNTKVAQQTVIANDTDKLDMQNANESTMVEIKKDIASMLQQFNLNNEDMINFITAIALSNNMQRSELENELKDFFKNDDQKVVVNWLFSTLKPKYQQKISQQQQSIVDEFNDPNNDFAEEIKSVEQQPTKLTSIVGQKGGALVNAQGANNAAGKLMMKACEDATNSTAQKQQQQQQEVIPKKIIRLDKLSEQQQESHQQKGDVFDRLQKKRTIEQRIASNIDVDLGTLIRNDNKLKGDHLNKRVKKVHQQPALEEVKLSNDGNTVIDLSTHKNNIRLKQQQKEFGSGDHDAEDKKKVKCRHWPNCNNSDDDCPYFHPKEDCPFFPKCQFGEKCIYIHPDIQCKFGYNCTRSNCAYKHPKNRMMPGGMGAGGLQKAMGLLMMASGFGIMGGQKPKNKKFVAGQEENQQNQEVTTGEGQEATNQQQ